MRETIDLKFYEVRKRLDENGVLVCERKNPFTNKWVEIPIGTYDWMRKFRKEACENGLAKIDTRSNC